MRNEPNLLEVDAPITGELSLARVDGNLGSAAADNVVCGDIHGQYVSWMSLVERYALITGELTGSMT